MTKGFWSHAAVLGCCLVWCGGIAHAQLHRATDPVATPASTIIGQDDAAAMDDNPAALGQLPSYSLVYVHTRADQRDAWLGQGDAVSLATPLLWGLALGVTAQSVRPGPLAATAGPQPLDRGVFGATLALAPSRRFSAGLSARTFTSGDARIDGLSAIDLGVLWRASNRLGFSLVGRDLFLSREGEGTAGLDLGSSMLLGARLQPLGTQDLVIAADLARGEDSRSGARLGVGIRVPYLGYASGLVEVDHLGDGTEAMRIVAELSASFEGLTLGAGGMGGDGFSKGAGYYAMIRVDGRARPGVIPAGRVLDVELSGVDARGMIDATFRMHAALHDDRVAGVLLRPRNSGVGLAYAQELRLAVASLRAAGKRVVCHLEDASGAEYYACAGADVILIDPAGSIRLMGSSTEVLLFGDTLRSAGLRADFVRIGDYKSAPEQFTQGRLSEPAREEIRTLLDDVHHRTLSDLSNDLSMPKERVADLMDQGPQLASQAQRDGMVTRTLDEAQLGDGEGDVFQGRSVTDTLPERARRDWGIGPRIGVVVIDGAIVDGESVDIPFLGVHMTGGRTVVETLDGMLADPLVRAIVVRVDSPGGAVLASDQIWRAIRRVRAHKPVVISMGAVAASGGYYVASAGDEIWADPSTLTGSIGIFYGKVDVVGLAEKLDVGIEIFKRGKHAGADSMFRPFTAEERAALTERLRDYYKLFLARVAEGRGKTPEQVDAVARGRVYTGDRALRVGLVDRLGGLASALARARQLAHVSDDAEVVVRPKRKSGLLDYVLDDVNAQSMALSPSVLVPGPLKNTLARIVTMHRLGATAALALLPYDVSY
jgi:protease IV